MKTMKTKNMFWAALSMAAALVMTACSSDNDVTETPAAPQAQKTIPYTVTVSNDDTSTRATVSDDPTNRQLYFATGDKLYITGTNIQGVLDLQDGDAGKATGATFAGELNYTGSGNPADDLLLNATLVSTQQTVGTQISVDAEGAVSVNYPTTAYCASVNDAVQQYSKLKGSSTYGAKSFSLSQQTAFLNFVITFDDGTASGTELSTVVSNGNSAICTANVTTTTNAAGNVVAQFVLPVDGGTTLTSPTVTMGTQSAISFSGAMLYPKVYNVKRTCNHPSALGGKFSVSATKQVYFSKGNLQATTSDLGASWTWAFAEKQWDKVGNAAVNTSITGTSSPTVSANGTVDLFGWSTSKTYLGISKYSDNSNYEGSFVDWGSHADVIAGVGSGWRTLTGNEWYYLFIERSTTSGLRFCKAKVGDCFGVILLPDDWSTTYYTLEDCNETDARNFADNTIKNKITLDDWRSMFEANGAVFLPTTGHRYASDNTSVEAPDGRLYYWSATGSGEIANQMYIAGGSVSPNTGGGRHFGNAVRLVRDITVK